MKAKLFILLLLCSSFTAFSQDIVINKIYNSGVTNPQGQDDIVELLVTKDFTDIRNLVIKDFTGGTLTATSLTDNGGKFRFKNIDFWRNLRIGTLIVLRYSPTSSSYVQDADPIDKVIDLRLDNTTYFTNEGGEPFNVQNYDMVLLKTGLATGTDNAVYAAAFGISFDNTTFSVVSSPKAYTNKIAPTNGTLYSASNTGTINDYAGEDHLLSTTTSPTPIIWGVGTGAPNIAYISHIRSFGDYNYVHREGSETIAGTKTFTGMVIINAGSVQTAPTANNHIATKKYVDDAIALGGGGGGSSTLQQITVNGATTDRAITVSNGTVNSFLSFNAPSSAAVVGANSNHALQLWAGASSKAVITAAGNFGMGVPNPNEKLEVNGNIRTKKVMIDPLNGWPDYVFADGYAVPKLDEIESFIKKYRHLPEVPSAEQVGKNGFELAEMNKLLLKKIEELTLLLIEKDKQLRATDARLDELAVTVGKLVGKDK